MIVESLQKFSQLAGKLVSHFRASPETPKDRAPFVDACFDLLRKLRDLAWDIRKDIENPERLREIPGREEAREKIHSLLKSFEKVFETQLLALKHVPKAAEGAETDDVWWKGFTFHVYVEPPQGSPSRKWQKIAQAMERDLAPLERFEKELQGIRTWLEGLPSVRALTASSAAQEGELDPGREKRMIRRQVKEELKSMLEDDALVLAYKQHGSYRKAAAALSEDRGCTITKDRVQRAVKRGGGIPAVMRTESSSSIVRPSPSHRRDTKGKR
jgi:hypothetical protein